MSSGSGGQVKTVVIIIIIPCHNIHNGHQVPRPPRPGQTQVPQVGDDIPGGEGTLREARISLPGDPMRHMTVVTDVMFQDKMAKLPKSRNIQPKRFVMAREIKNRFRTVKRDSLTPTFPEFVNYVVSVDIDNLIKTVFLIFKVATWEEAGMREESMMKLVNMHWKPVYVNCGPCKQRCCPYNPVVLPLHFTFYIPKLKTTKLYNFRYDIIMKMETLSRDTQYLKVRIIS